MKWVTSRGAGHHSKPPWQRKSSALTIPTLRYFPMCASAPLEQAPACAVTVPTCGERALDGMGKRFFYVFQGRIKSQTLVLSS